MLIGLRGGSRGAGNTKNGPDYAPRVLTVLDPTLGGRGGVFFFPVCVGINSKSRQVKSHSSKTRRGNSTSEKFWFEKPCSEK